LDNLIDKWIYFIKYSENLAIIPENTTDTGLLSAYKDAEKHNWTKEELEEYEYAQMREQDEKGEIELAEERAEQKAKQQEKIEIANEMIVNNEPIEKIVKYTKLKIETIEKLINEMKNSH